MDDAIVAFRCLKALFFFCAATKDVLGSETGARVLLRARNTDDEMMMMMIKGDKNDKNDNNEIKKQVIYLYVCY